MPSARAMFSFTYRYQNHAVAEGDPHSAALPVGATTGGTVTISENAGSPECHNAAGSNWELNGSDRKLATAITRSLRFLRASFATTACTPATSQSPGLTVSGVYNDLERHNNTNNNQSAVTAGDDPYEGPLNHVDHTRIASINASLAPNEHYSFDMSYVYSNVYTATNICFDNGDQNASTTRALFQVRPRSPAPALRMSVPAYTRAVPRRSSPTGSAGTS